MLCPQTLAAYCQGNPINNVPWDQKGRTMIIDSWKSKQSILGNDVVFIATF